MRIVTMLALCTVLCCALDQKQEECLNLHITPPMIKDIMETSELIQKYLPRDNAPYHQILGKLKKCSKKLNAPDFKRILEIYDEHVFQNLWKNNTHQLPKLFMDSFARLKDMMEICETKGKQTLSQCARENLKTIEDKLKMLQPNGLYKAQSEFRSVLVWISNAMDKSRTHEIH
ncbi:interleukin-26 [Carassius carassius]|uniref:interleukin-26 n=1 Tax=Carassius carassius TaxID=217509 RepID=UPI002868848C|nr:interleukin-26 [Carassius carassius]